MNVRSINKPRTLTESVSKHSQAVLEEGRKNAFVKKWTPVLEKCREIPRKKLGTIAAVLENVIDTEDRVTHAVRGVQIDPKSGLLSVSGGPLRRAAEVRSLAYDE